MAAVMIAGDDIGFLGQRPRTDIGPQGDHVTSYALFEEFLKRLPRENPEEYFSRLGTTLLSLKQMSEKYENVFEEAITSEEAKALAGKNEFIEQALMEIVAEIEKIKPKIATREDLEKILKSIAESELKGKAEELIMLGNQALFNQIEAHASSVFIEIRNKLKYTCFPIEGSIKAPTSEGAQISGAIRKLHSFKAVDKKDIPEIIEVLQQLFWYPKVPKEVLIDLKIPKDKDKWRSIRKKKKYNASTQPRHNDLRILYYVTARHLDTVAACFPILNVKPASEEIIEGFISALAKDWEMTEIERKNFLEGANSLRNKEKKDLKEKTELQEAIREQLPSDIPLPAAGHKRPTTKRKKGKAKPKPPASPSEERANEGTAKRTEREPKEDEEEAEERSHSPSPLSDKDNQDSSPLKSPEDSIGSKVRKSHKNPQQRTSLPLRSFGLYKTRLVPRRSELHPAALLKVPSSDGSDQTKRKGKRKK